jgi:O-antigen/teichoic acid export membrane protein
MTGLGRNFFWMLLSRIGQMTAGLLAAILINRSLGPAGRGLLAEVQTWCGLLAIVWGLSMDTAIYHTANRVQYTEKESIKFASVLGLSSVVAIVASTWLTMLTWFRPDLVSEAMIRYILLLDAYVFVFILGSNLAVFFLAQGHVRFASLIGLAQIALNALIVGCAFLVSRITLSLALTSLFLAQLIPVLVMLVMAGRLGYLPGRFSVSLIKRLILAGIKQHPATVCTFIYTRANQLILFHYCGEVETGHYALALNLASQLMVIPMAFQAVLYPRIIHEQDDHQVTVRSMNLGFYIWGVMVLGAFVLAKPLVLVYGGAEFLSAVPLFRVLLPMTWLMPLSAMVAPFYVKKGAFLMASLTAIVLGLVSVGLNYLFIPRLGSWGAAWATTVTTSFGFGLSLAFLWYLSRKNPLMILIPPSRREWLGIIDRLRRR